MRQIRIVAAADANGDILFDENGVAQNRIFSRFDSGDRKQNVVFEELVYEFIAVRNHMGVDNG